MAQAEQVRGLPKGHIIGWVAPSSATKPAATAKPVSTVDANGNPLSKAALKNAKRKAKKKAAGGAGGSKDADGDDDVQEEEEPEAKPEPKEEDVPESWDDDEEPTAEDTNKSQGASDVSNVADQLAGLAVTTPAEKK